MLLDLNLLPMNVDSERFSEDLDDGPRGLLVCGCLVDEPASQVAPVFRADGQVLLEEPRLPTRSTAVLRGSVFRNPPLDVARAKAKVDPRLLEALVSVRTLDAASGAARWRPELDNLLTRGLRWIALSSRRSALRTVGLVRKRMRSRW